MEQPPLTAPEPAPAPAPAHQSLSDLFSLPEPTPVMETSDTVEAPLPTGGSSPFFNIDQQDTNPADNPILRSMMAAANHQANDDDTQAQQAGQGEDAGAPQISDLEVEDEGDDTVKSINDALRGLFR